MIGHYVEEERGRGQAAKLRAMDLARKEEELRAWRRYNRVLRFLVVLGFLVWLRVLAMMVAS